MTAYNESRIELLKERLDKLAANKEFVNCFNELQSIMYTTALLKGWHSPSKTFGEQNMMMVTEIAEVIEAYREVDGQVDRTWISEGGKPEGVPVEYADLVIRVLDTCDASNINLLGAIIWKAKFNLTRSNRHGDKKL